MSITPDLMPPCEAERLAAVRRYDILDTPPDGAFDRIAAIASRELGVPIAIVSVVDTNRIWFKSHHGLDVTEIGRDPGLCASAILQTGPWIINDAATDPRTLANPLVAGDFGLRFYAGVPLTTRDGYNLGTLCVIDQKPREITECETALLTDLAALVIDELELRLNAHQAIASAQARLTEVERLATALQHSLLPPSLPSIEWLELAAVYRPTSRYEVGGDFYDVFPLDDQSWGLVIGDVCGKGPGAAGRTSCARYSLRAAAIHEPSPSAVMTTVNQALLAESGGGPDAPFVTAFFARVDHLAGAGLRMSFASAGHPLPTVLRANGKLEVVGTTGTLLGAFTEIESVDCYLDLAAGDTFVLITDGVHDSGHPQPLLQEGVEAILRNCVGAPAQTVVDRITAAVSDAQRDDIAVLVATARA